MSRTKEKKPPGELRESQVIRTFGPGAMLDLPNHAVLVGGLETWTDPVKAGRAAIREERLLTKVRRALGRHDVQLFAPPADTGDGGHSGIGVYLFPEWFVSQLDEKQREGFRTRRLLHRRELVKGKYFSLDKKRHPVVPIRFVMACVNGHIADLDWHGFTHEYQGTCRRKLWLDERGTSGDLADIQITCECGSSRSLAQALPHGGSVPLGYCKGFRPWLDPHAREECAGDEGRPQRNRLLIRSASDAYFPQVLGVISIPEADTRLRTAVDAVWEDFLQYAESVGDVARERKKERVARALEGHADEAVFAEVARRSSGLPPLEKNIKEAELETLVAATGKDPEDGEFFAQPLALDPKRTGPMAKVERVVLVHRLREVTAQIGFTRFEAEVPDIDGELALDVTRAALAREASWVPAIENRGEGIFIELKSQALRAWEERIVAEKNGRVDSLRAGFEAWQGQRQSRKRRALQMPGVRYVMLHSLSHLLVTAVSLACGYAASSVRERIYVTPAGSGILLYTGTPDSEGTLGGLVEIGKNLDRHLRAALEMGRLCSNDPVCAQHRPKDPHEERYLHGAACHGCLLIAEPSCERRNEHLDRALVIPTVEDHGVSFFDEDDLG